jgi:serine/threonine-protein kinase RsbW
VATADIIPLGQRLRERRRDLGLSQAEAARELDVARTAYRLWEMEAAKPSPDRWRLIARWLGVSVAAMLLAEELIDEDEAVAAGEVSARSDAAGMEWDTSAAERPGDFFAQERHTIADRQRLGMVTNVESERMRAALARVQRASEVSPGGGPAEFSKDLPRDPTSPAIARSAVLVTAVGVPRAAIEDAELLTSELVTNSVQHAGGDTIRLHVVLGPSTLRVEIADASERSIRPRTDGEPGGFGLMLVAALATRWGGGRVAGTNITWFEIDF